MTEKRFKLFVGKNYGVQKADGEVIFDSIVSIGDADVLVDWLNALYNENEELKEDNMLLIEDSEKYRKLSIQFDNRNKELISENEQLKHDATVLIQANQDYRRENEQLKQLLRCADDIIHWNTVPQCRRDWERQKERILNE